ncbi:UPF0481 protein At3g47200-like [Lotus japonicus]|uniref:UPF0481 protein At3g47200-like n=1 Tax=Lotus japonicus TaxID=34305 RepID=UPI00258949C8|nr:UPF0481 protein At3g47200-like [Lotus japonicus]
MDIKYNRWKNITAVMLGTINNETFFKARSVSVVLDELRKWNENAYVPKVISIGPRYNGRQELLPMEEINWRCMFHLFNRSLGYTISPDKYVNNCMDTILKMDVAVRSSYLGEIELDRYDLAAIVFNDGCFLLEFLISGSSIDSVIPPFGGRISAIGPNPALEIGKMEVVMRDHTLLENQIPLFVLGVLFQNIFDKGFHYLVHEIHNRALSLFGFHGDLKSVDSKFAHFLELASWNINKE